MVSKKRLLEKSRIVQRANQNRSEFFDFIKNYNVIELAIGVVVGGAAKDFVGSIVNDLIMPAIGLITPSGSWTSIVIKFSGAEFKIGNFISSALNFFIIAIVVFVMIKKILRIGNEEKVK